MKPWPLLPTLLLVAPLLLLAPGCGYGGYEEGYVYVEPLPPPLLPPPPILYGTVALDNLSLEFIETFFLAPAATDAWSDDLLPAPLPPDSLVDLGDWPEDAYDAEADLEFGDLVTWFDVPVPGGDVTTFEIY
ncbi:MAG: hypothetical protein ACC662_07645 [Planctomycetota bacterium]